MRTVVTTHGTARPSPTSSILEVAFIPCTELKATFRVPEHEMPEHGVVDG